MKRFIQKLQFLFDPVWWSMYYPYNKYVDEVMNLLLDKYDFTEIEQYTAKLGDTVIWIENRPYGSIRFYGTEVERFRPSRLTIKKALDRLKKQEWDIRKKDLQKIKESI